MRRLEIDKSEIQLEILGESGSKIIWFGLRESNNWYAFEVQVILDWAEVLTSIEVSEHNLAKLAYDLRKMLGNQSSKLEFDVEYGRLSLIVEVEKRGNVFVKGIIGRNGLETDELKFTFESHLSELDNFQSQIDKLLKQLGISIDPRSFS